MTKYYKNYLDIHRNNCVITVQTKVTISRFNTHGGWALSSKHGSIDAIQILQMFAEKVSVSANVNIIHLNFNKEI